MDKEKVRQLREKLISDLDARLKPTFKGTNREATPIDVLNAYTSAPLKRFIMNKIKGEDVPLNFGADPETQPSGKDIAHELGVSDKPLFGKTFNVHGNIPASLLSLLSNVNRDTAAGFGVDMATDPTNYIPNGLINKMGVGAAGTIKSKNLRSILKSPETKNKNLFKYDISSAQKQGEDLAESQKQALVNWLGGDEDRLARLKLMQNQMPKDLKEKALEEISSQTSVKVGDDGKRHFALVRVMGPKEASRAGQKTINPTGSWTTNYDFAQELLEDNPGHKLAIAWIPEDQIVSIPGSYAKTGKNTGIGSGIKREREVIVAGDIAALDKPPLSKEEFINERKKRFSEFLNKKNETGFLDKNKDVLDLRNRDNLKKFAEQHGLDYENDVSMAWPSGPNEFSKGFNKKINELIKDKKIKDVLFNDDDFKQISLGKKSSLYNKIENDPTIFGLSKSPNILDELNTLDKVKEIRGTPKYKEYLKALDEKYGDQAKRAKDMGFGSKDWLHGTGRSFTEFDSDRLGEMTGGPTKKLGHHFTDNPNVANQYAFHGENYGKGVGQIYPVKLKTKGGTAYTSDNSMPDVEDAENILNAYRKTDFKPVILKDMNDALFPDAASTVGDIAVVPQPNQIRSKFAAFDPRFADSADLLAGGVGAVDPRGLLSVAPMLQADKLMSAIQDRKNKNSGK